MTTNISTLIKAMTRRTDAKQSSSHGRVWRFIAMALTAGFLASNFAGCRALNQFDPMRTFDEPLACYRNNVWAKRAYNLRYGNCDREYGDHFREGFISGYCDVCEGGQGYIPAMPPQDYWETRYQCPEGAKCVNAWFEGFPAGVAAAKKDGSGAYHDVYISNMINAAVVQENSPTVLPGDIPVTPASTGPGAGDYSNQGSYDMSGMYNSPDSYSPGDYSTPPGYGPAENYGPAGGFGPASSYGPTGSYGPDGVLIPDGQYPPVNNYIPASSELVPTHTAPPIVPDNSIDPSAGMPMPMSMSVQPAVYDMSGYNR